MFLMSFLLKKKKLKKLDLSIKNYRCKK